MKLKRSAFISILIIASSCSTQKGMTVYESDTIKIEKLGSGTYMHTSYLQTTDFGNVACNGMFVIDNGEALIFDTPTDNAESTELISWIELNLKSKVAGIVVTHFHMDCLGGLQSFHDKGIPSYANNNTIELAKSEDRTLPENGFDQFLDLKIGKNKVMVEYPGQGHTVDNVVGYFPKDKVLFGGCLIKSIGAGKGNLEDANIEHWPKTVQNIRDKYNDVKTIIPGHGRPGDANLLDYTIELFKEE